MPATNGSRMSRNSTTAAISAASMVIQNAMGRADIIRRQCEANVRGLSKGPARRGRA